MYVAVVSAILRGVTQGVHNMSHHRGRRIKQLKTNPYEDPAVFYMSLEEAKEAIAGKYEFLAERYERAKPKRSKPIQS